MYDFDTVYNRRNTSSMKWDVADNELPMWVADMDFQTAPEVRDALLQRVQRGIFGYEIVPDEWARTYVNHWRTRYKCEWKEDWLIFCTGVVPAISSIVRKITTPAENVVLLTPVYGIFYNSVLNNGRRVLECPLDYAEHRYTLDFDRLEAALSDPQTSLLILCNPHNPVGIIWSREELAKIGELCYKNNVTVLSDEIHCDITDPDCNYTPFSSASELCRDISITCVSPTKAFNLAGLQTAAVVVANERLRHKVWRGLNTDEIAEPNAFACAAAIASYTKGGKWLDELRAYIRDNRERVYTFLKSELPTVSAVRSQATYLVWLDCSAVCDDTDDLARFVRNETGLYVSSGAQFGGNGKLFIRLNIACQRSVLNDGLLRLANGVRAYNARNTEI